MLTDRPRSARLPPLGALRAFAVAARRRSMVAAAAELYVTHGAVSKQVQALEAELGTALFERRNRGIHLTRDGEWLAERLTALFGDLDRTLHDFRERGRGPGPLTLSCEPTLCLRLLIPALGALKQDAGLDLRLLAAGGPVEFARDHIDLAIRRSDFALPRGVETAILAAERMGPVMRPDLAAACPATLPRLSSDSRPAAWQRWHDAGGASFSGPAIRFEHFYHVIEAAEAGQGVALASVHMVGEALRTGRLAAPHGFAPDGTHYLALWREGRLDARGHTLVAWARARLGMSHA